MLESNRGFINVQYRLLDYYFGLLGDQFYDRRLYLGEISIFRNGFFILSFMYLDILYFRFQEVIFYELRIEL